MRGFKTTLPNKSMEKPKRFLVQEKLNTRRLQIGGRILRLLHRYNFRDKTSYFEFKKKTVIILLIWLFHCCFLQILIRFPNGERREQCFLCTDKVQSIYRYIDSLSLPGIANYRLISSFPKRVYGVDQMGITLKDAGLHPRATLFLELLWHQFFLYFHNYWKPKLVSL